MIRLKSQIRTALLSAAFSAAFLITMPAFAQCEDSASASNAMNTIVSDEIQVLNDFINQTRNFLDEDLTNTATNEVVNRMDDFETNVLAALNDWWPEYEQAMKDMTKQLHTSQLEQTSQLSMALDQTIQAEVLSSKEKSEDAAANAFQPNETTCQADSVGAAAVKAQRVAKSLAKSYGYTDNRRRNNATGTPAAAGKGAEAAALWAEYVANFCDPAKGDKGCAVAGPLAGQNTNVSGMLFGERQTIDMSNAQNRMASEVAMRTFISPQSPDPVPPGALNSASGKDEILMRRARSARMNTVYNAVGQLMGERVGVREGAAPNTAVSEIRQAGGTNASVAPADASYKETGEALTRARFFNPQYVVRLVENPEQITREIGAVKAVQLQKLNDLYRRSEEMLYMEAANISAKLDERVPSTAIEAAPVR